MKALSNVIGKGAPARWRLRIGVLIICLIGVITIFATNSYLTQRYTESTNNRAELRLTLYVANLMSELRQNSIVPQLLARDPELIRALDGNDYSLSTARLLSFVEEIGAASLMLLDVDGRAVAATDRNRLGGQHKAQPYFINALRSNETNFSVIENDAGGFNFVYSRKMEDRGVNLGVIAVEVDMRKLERGWAGVADAVFVTDSEGHIILTTESSWRGQLEQDALAIRSAPSAIERAIRATQDWTALPTNAYFSGDAVLRREARVPFQGWRMVSFTAYSSVRERVNGVLALEVMGFAIVLALIFWQSSRKTASRMVFFQRESAELRQLNRRLQQEIAEREKVEKTLEVAEQTLLQSSKLAALGEMSAAVSHELNQPLAAMKTYLAGARLLLQRKRADEALSSFQRIDDLIERMGAITRQLKSYARKGSDAFEAVDSKAAVSSALSMMRISISSLRSATPSH